MALAKLIPKIGALLLQPRIQQVLPSTSFKTSASNSKWIFFWPYCNIKPEYDEQGELGFPEDDDLATGMWKKELDARNAGIEDPYDVDCITRGDKGSKLDPIMVPSAFESRIIGCKCHEDQYTVFGMWLHQGEPKRCRCGFWHVLYYKEPFMDYSLPQ